MHGQWSYQLVELVLDGLSFDSGLTYLLNVEVPPTSSDSRFVAYRDFSFDHQVNVDLLEA